jgi:hypothetical protein
MTLQEFQIYWSMSKQNAQSYLAHGGFMRKYDGKYQYRPEEIEAAHKHRLEMQLDKQQGEIDFKQIYEKYKAYIGKGSLMRLAKSKDFVTPKCKRKCQRTKKAKRVWDEDEVEDFFSSFEGSTETRKRKRVRTIEGIKAAFILFNSGMTHKIKLNETGNIDNVIKTRFKHCSILESLRD